MRPWVAVAAVLLVGCADTAAAPLAMARPDGLELRARPELAAMARHAPYLLDVRLPAGDGLEEALDAVERLNAMAGGELLLAAEADEASVATLENVNLGDSSVAGNTVCTSGFCDVTTNYRYERQTCTWEHELMHALGYIGNDPSDPRHDLDGMMEAVNGDCAVNDAMRAHLRAALGG